MDSEDQSSYYSVEGMSKIQNKNLGDISIVHVNARSLVLNFDSIISFLEKANLPEIICISETRLQGWIFCLFEVISARDFLQIRPGNMPKNHEK